MFSSHLPLWFVKILPGLILFFATVNYTILVGERRIYSVTISVLHQVFGNRTSLTELNWIGATCNSLTYFVIPFATNAIILLNRPYQLGMTLGGVICSLSYFASAFVKHTSWLFLTYSFVHIIGASIVLSTVALIVGEYFDKTHRFHLVATTLTSQGAIGGLIYGSFDGIVIAKLGYKNMFLIVGGFMLFWMILAAFVFVPKERDQELLEGEDKPEEMDSWKKRPIWVIVPWNHLKENFQIVLWCLERIIHHVILASLYLNMVDFLVVIHGMSIEYASTVLIAWSIGETIILGVVFLGPILHPHLGEVYFVCSILTIPITAVLITASKNVTVLFILIFFEGLVLSGCKLNDYATSILVMRIHGSVSFPMTLMMNGMGFLIAPVFSGLIIDRYKGYREFFVGQVILSIIRSVLWIAILLILRIKSRDTRDSHETNKSTESAAKLDEKTSLVSGSK